MKNYSTLIFVILVVISTINGYILENCGGNILIFFICLKKLRKFKEPRKIRSITYPGLSVYDTLSTCSGFFITLLNLSPLYFHLGSCLYILTKMCCTSSSNITYFVQNSTKRVRFPFP